MDKAQSLVEILRGDTVENDTGGLALFIIVECM